MGLQIGKRRLQDTTFAPSQTLQLPLPKDALARSLMCILSGSTSYTFSGGTPTAPTESTFDTLIYLIQVNVNGRNVKTVRPHMLKVMEILASSQEMCRKASAGASAAAGNNPTTDGGFAFGTTGQYTTAREAVQIPFEMVLASTGATSTWLDLRGANQAEVKFFTSPYSALDTAGATALAFANGTFLIESYLEEVIGVPAGFGFRDFKQTWYQESISATVSGKYYELNTGNLHAGLMLYVKDGNGNPTDLGITDIAIKVGNVTVKETNFLEAQDWMRGHYRSNSPRSSGKSRLDGVAYIPLLTNQDDLNTAFDGRAVKSIRLVISTRSSGVTYPLMMNYEQHEIVQVSR